MSYVPIRSADYIFYEIYWLVIGLHCPVGHHINWFSAFDVIIRGVYCLTFLYPLFLFDLDM